LRRRFAIASRTPKPAAKTRLEKWLQFTQLAQGIATAIALVAGAIWFMEQRQTYPHAQVQQSVEAVSVGRGLVAVEVQVQFQNSGKLLIHLTHATVKLQNVTPDPYDYAALAEENGDSYWKARRPVPTPDPRQFNQGELRWPVLKQYDGPIDHVIEPGETDLLVFTFLVPCQSDPSDKATELHEVRVASDIHKPVGHGKDLAWKARAFADVSAACRKKGAEE
jgi:hypothetical protein